MRYCSAIMLPSNRASLGENRYDQTLNHFAAMLYPSRNKFTDEPLSCMLENIIYMAVIGRVCKDEISVRVHPDCWNYNPRPKLVGTATV